MRQINPNESRWLLPILWLKTNNHMMADTDMIKWCRLTKSKIVIWSTASKQVISIIIIRRQHYHALNSQSRLVLLTTPRLQPTICPGPRSPRNNTDWHGGCHLPTALLCSLCSHYSLLTVIVTVIAQLYYSRFHVQFANCQLCSLVVDDALTCT